MMRPLGFGFLAISTVIAIALSDCAGTKPITRRSELSDPIETGPITLLASDGTKFIFNNYRLNDSSITGVGVRATAASGEETAFTGDVPFSSISSIHARDTKVMKFLVATTGVVAFGIIAAAEMDKNDFRVRDIVSYRGPTGGPISCPFLYSHDGERYTFASETFAGAIIKPAERTVFDALPCCAATDGAYRLKLTNERPETHYTNMVALRAVDAAETLEVIADRKGRVHTVARRTPPVAAHDLSGRDISRLIEKKDSLLWRSSLLERTGGARNEEEFTDGLVVEFAKPRDAESMKLLVGGKNSALGVFAFQHMFELTGSKTLEWYKKAEEDSLEAARVLHFLTQVGMLHIYLEQDDGQWTECGMLDDAGPLIEKEQLALVDCRKIGKERVRVKLVSTVDLWMINSVTADFSEDAAVDEHACPLLSARADDGRDVSSELKSDDARYFTTVTGQWAELRFAVPPPSSLPSQRRHLIAATKGYYHQWFSNSPESHVEMVERIIDEPGYGARLFLPEWKKVRAASSVDASARDADLDR